MRVTVVGAGVAGLSCALELAERGVAVEVLERGEYLGSSCCSWYAGGMLAPWCELADSESQLLKLGAGSIEWWSRTLPATERNGTLVVAHRRDRSELTRFARRTHQFEWLDEAAITQLEPDLAGRFNSALFFRGEGHLDPRAALEVLTRRLTESGVPIRFGVRSLADATAGADRVVDCRGLAAHLQQVGTKFVRQVEQEPFGLIATVADPDGNYIHIIQWGASPEDHKA